MLTELVLHMPCLQQTEHITDNLGPGVRMHSPVVCREDRAKAVPASRIIVHSVVTNTLGVHNYGLSVLIQLNTHSQ